jgi:hypothetical protein
VQTISQQDWQKIPEQAQQEVYDFFLFLKQRYSDVESEADTLAFSHHSANLLEEWKSDVEDEVWK